MNHACSFNAVFSAFLDVQIVRAMVDIEKGAEVTIPYTGYHSSYQDRKEKLEKWLGSTLCACELCVEDRRDGTTNLETRKLIAERGPGGSIDGGVPSVRIKVEINKVEQLIKDLQATYHPNRSSFRPELYSFYQRLGYLNFNLSVRTNNRSIIPKVIENETKALESLGITLTNRLSKPPCLNNQDPSLPIVSPPRSQFSWAVQSAIVIAEAYRVLGEGKEARSWIGAAVWMDNITTGGGVELFKKAFEKEMKQLVNFL